MGKIVLEIEEFAKTHSEYKSFDQDCIRIGRAFDNDLIINDPFVGASHISLIFTDGTWKCENNQSLNGTFISTKGKAKTKVDTNYPIHSGDTILLGKTSIHIWDINHPVAAEQSLGNKSAFSFDPRKTMPSLLFALGVFCFIYYLYLSQWSWKRNNTFFQVVAEICFLSFCLVIWSGMWALITRFSKRQHRFLQHLVFSFQWAVISLALSFASKYIYFFICNSALECVVSLGIFGIFSIFILNGHLAIGTNLSFIKRNIISGSIAFFIILLVGLSYYAKQNDFSPEPQHYINIVPVPKRFVPTISINEEIKRLDSIF